MAAPRKYAVGKRIRVNMGVSAGKEGTIIPRENIPLRSGAGGMIPDVGAGHYKPMDKDSVAIRFDDGKLDVFNKVHLDLI